MRYSKTFTAVKSSLYRPVFLTDNCRNMNSSPSRGMLDPFSISDIRFPVKELVSSATG